MVDLEGALDPLVQAASFLSSSSSPPPLVRQATPAPAAESTLLGQPPKEGEKNGRRKSIPRPSMVQRPDTPASSLRLDSVNDFRTALETGTREAGVQ